LAGNTQSDRMKRVSECVGFNVWLDT